MKRALALTLTLGAIWSLIGNCQLVFLVWYSGVDPEMTFRDWFDLAVQATVNVAAVVLVWRFARKRASDPTH